LFQPAKRLSRLATARRDPTDICRHPATPVPLKPPPR
jgi:hypothetical protein